MTMDSDWSGHGGHLSECGGDRRGGGYSLALVSWQQWLCLCAGGYTVSALCPLVTRPVPVTGYNTVWKYVAEMLHQWERHRQVVVSNRSRAGPECPTWPLPPDWPGGGPGPGPHTTVATASSCAQSQPPLASLATVTPRVWTGDIDNIQFNTET